MTNPTPLSPAAQAVLDAYRSTHLSINNLAAALRAVADQLGESRAPGLEPENLYGRIIDVDDLLVIVTELEHYNRSN